MLQVYLSNILRGSLASLLFSLNIVNNYHLGDNNWFSYINDFDNAKRLHREKPLKQLGKSKSRKGT